MSATTSLCSICLKSIPAKKYAVGTDVFLEKNCPEHGIQKVRIAKDAKRFFDTTFAVEGKSLHQRQTATQNGCPDDCGYCPKHAQHICTGLVEITNKCNLRCPICYSVAENENGCDISTEEFADRLETLLKAEGGRLDVLQISGGEPTLHEKFGEILEIAVSKNVGRVLVNTNGLKIHEDGNLVRLLEKHKDRAEVYLQFDGFDDDVYRILRGKPLLEQKLKTVEMLDNLGIKMSLTATIGRCNLKEIAAILDFACKVESITGITFQRLAAIGRFRETASNDSAYIPVMQEDILYNIGQSGKMKYDDLIPLPCSHVNCTSIGFLFKTKDGSVRSLSEFVDYRKCKDILSDKIAFDRSVLESLKQNTCCCFSSKILNCVSFSGDSSLLKELQEFAQGNGSSHNGMKMLRILVKNFMDSTTFDAERAQKCCVGVSVGGNRIIPFCVNNIKRTAER